jgi:TPR repeat protein
VTEDKQAARALYIRACDMGSKDGCDLLDQSLSAAR